MKYVISQADLADLKAKVQSWFTKIYNHKHYQKIKKRVTSYLNLCNQFYLESITNLCVFNLSDNFIKNADIYFKWL